MTIGAEAQTAVADHLTVTTRGQAVVAAGSVDRLAAATLLVSAQQVTRTESRWLIDVDITAYVRYATPVVGDSELVALLDVALDGIMSMRDTEPVWWLGPSTPTQWTQGEDLEVDGQRYLSGVLSIQVASDLATSRAVGPTEQTVRDTLAAAGLTVVDSCDIATPCVVTRWGGAAADDPARTEILVVAATEINSGLIETHARAVWRALTDDPHIAVTSRLDVDHLGSPPGSIGGYETAALTVSVLSDLAVPAGL